MCVREGGVVLLGLWEDTQYDAPARGLGTTEETFVSSSATDIERSKSIGFHFT